MGRTALFPSEGKRLEDFFAPKNPAVSVGSEPANLGTKGQISALNTDGQSQAPADLLRERNHGSYHTGKWEGLRRRLDV